jgi:GNAT superfamily N-acetyltransferase
METRHLLAHDLEAAFKISQEYLGGPRAKFFQWYRENPDLFVGVFEKDSLIGICYGMDWKRQSGYVLLQGIATVHSYWRSGAGSLLVRFFEQQVEKREKQRITLGSAADMKTENFYLKNGYAPVSLCAKLKNTDLPVDYERLGYEFCEIRRDGDEVILYVEKTIRDKQFQTQLKDDLGAEEVIFIMEKDVTSKLDSE